MGWALDRIYSPNKLKEQYPTGRGVDIYVLDGSVHVWHDDFEGRVETVFTAKHLLGDYIAPHYMVRPLRMLS
jgi:hypothetical protein